MAFDARVEFRLGRNFSVGPNVGGVLVNVGPGKNNQVISTEKQFSPPGIDRQTDFFRTGVYAGFDWRDNPGGSRSGGLYGFDYSYYDDRDLGRHDFHLMKLRAEQYIPFFNKRRVIALRGQTIFTWTGDGKTVPFYFQPVLGGSDDLRGYQAYRFYGDNSLLLNAEYQWEVFSGLNGAIFADAGKVADRRRNLDFKDLESSVGFGLRFNIRNTTFIRFDVGFSHEGYQIWFTFDDFFIKKPAGRSSPEHVF
jgi:outer membrane protein assembly factor BamA